MANTIEDYKKFLDRCGSVRKMHYPCYEMCPYRENGGCELSEDEGIRLCLEELLGKKFDYREDLLIQLLKMIP